MISATATMKLKIHNPEILLSLTLLIFIIDFARALYVKGTVGGSKVDLQVSLTENGDLLGEAQSLVNLIPSLGLASSKLGTRIKRQAEEEEGDPLPSAMIPSMLFQVTKKLALCQIKKIMIVFF